MAIGATLIGASPAAVADTVAGRRASEGFVERDHSIEALAHSGYLELTVRRTIENVGMEVDEATVDIELSGTEVATNLRSQGIVGGRTVWFQGELLDAEVAASRYAYLTGYGQAIPKDPAWLYWTSPNGLGLQVFPCPPRQPKTVEYRLIAPMAYADGRFSTELSPLGSEAHRASFAIASANARHRLWLNGHELAPGSHVKSPKDATSIHVEFDDLQSSVVAGELAVVDLGTGRSYVRAELRAKPELATIPRDAYVIVLFDMSRSIGDSWEPERRLFEQLLSQFPDVKVAAWGFDRTARPILDRFGSFEEARAKVEAFPKRTRNGSRIDLALQASAHLLAAQRVPRERTRVFLLTDARVATSIGERTVEAAIRRLPATVQLAEVSDGSCSVVHSPEMPWTKAVEESTGTAWSVWTSGGANDCRSEVEELARPKRFFVDAISLEGANTAIELPSTLDEGQAFVHEAVVAGRARALVFEAKLWGRPVSRHFAVNGPMSHVRAALATASSDFDLTDPELRALAMYGRAVTRLTSYLAIEPGVRPSRDGFSGGLGFGQGFGVGGGGLSGHGSSSNGADFDRQAHLEREIDAARKSCGIGFLRVNVELETSLDEVLDVVRADVPDAPPSSSGCLIERLWELELPRQFNQRRATFVVLR